mmetsp:Transcript_47076/g.69739  ORF Transcript_47076/g.69739 Transcript_47076/m.69739 type:complete len:127 (+) Transcript_47076:104-484(+)|eukprot:CAMPEP_0195533120 /NCGR_PEP_ID=MMETSP0794_2-20130614/39904_1 /TAXON_ID=515487 /ORGANISM="Stephanopyxis turris, Strain CCMP 815" /LENGTH=126 /DNA_ID=CAMNT_0040665555 /DNA_START=82 /DNA_END=462 /DNA_ORIENTATION=-
MTKPCVILAALTTGLSAEALSMPALTDSRRSFLSKAIPSTFGIASASFLTSLNSDSLLHVDGCSCVNCAITPHDNDCSCVNCAQSRVFGPRYAMAYYGNDVGDESSSAETKAMNIQFRRGKQMPAL